MTLIIFDQGKRVETPIKSLMQPRGIEPVSSGQSARGTSVAEEQKRLLEQGILHLDGDNARSLPGPQSAYEQAQNAGKSKTSKPSLRAQQIMTFPVQVILPSATVRQAWLQLEEYSISHLVVVDEKERLLGLISRMDVIRHGTDSTISVAVAYNKHIVAAELDTDLSSIASSFVYYPIAAIPVVDKANRLLGIISRTDLVRLLINNAQVESWA